jgi:hypothetical protein
MRLIIVTHQRNVAMRLPSVSRKAMLTAMRIGPFRRRMQKRE